jgi:hypothetical protein
MENAASPHPESLGDLLDQRGTRRIGSMHDQLFVEGFLRTITAPLIH